MPAQVRIPVDIRGAPAALTNCTDLLFKLCDGRIFPLQSGKIFRRKAKLRVLNVEKSFSHHSIQSRLMDTKLKAFAQSCVANFRKTLFLLFCVRN